MTEPEIRTEHSPISLGAYRSHVACQVSNSTPGCSSSPGPCKAQGRPSESEAPKALPPRGTTCSRHWLGCLKPHPESALGQ